MRAIGRAFRSCTICQHPCTRPTSRVRWTWQRSRSIGGSLLKSAMLPLPTSRADLLFRWKVTFPVLTFRSYPSQQLHNMFVLVQTHLNIDLVTTKDNGDVLTNPLQISVPVGNVLVGDSGSDVEHDNTTLSCGRRRTGECQLPCS